MSGIALMVLHSSIHLTDMKNGFFMAGIIASAAPL
jgi:hypothetical protein